MPIERILEPELMDSAADAAAYDAMDHSHVDALFVADLLRISPQPGRILDLGTGTAMIPLTLAKMESACVITAVDAAGHMLGLARKHVRMHGLEHRIGLAHVDAKKLRFVDGTYDTVMSNSIIHHIPQPECVFQEAVRLVRPGGWLFFRDLLRPDDQANLRRLVNIYAADCNEHQRQLFADSLHAALSLVEVQSIVKSLGFPGETVRATSDRHWTWSARRT